MDINGAPVLGAAATDGGRFDAYDPASRASRRATPPKGVSGEPRY